MMHVPQHITVADDIDHEYSRQERLPNMANMSGYAYQMNVPERILITGGNEIRGDRAPPSEIMLDRMPISYPIPELANPPGTLTLDKGPCPEIADEQPPSSRDPPPLQELLTSTAVEENPMRELKSMKRQLGRLSIRVYHLEDDFERRKSKDFLMWSYVLGVTGLIIYLLLKKKIK